MNTIRYLKLALLPALLATAAGCQPEPPEPKPSVAPPEGATRQPQQPPEQAPAKETPQQTPVARAQVSATENHDAAGEIVFIREGGKVRIEGRVSGLAPGQHGFHIHAEGDCSAPDAESAGDHFAPDGDPHGSPQDAPDQHHLGDFGNIVANDDGIAEFVKEDPEIRFDGADSIIGRAVIVHADRDDLESQPSGNAGARVACGVIEEVRRQAVTLDAAPALADLGEASAR